jgi:acetolactate synthase-1/2/3 large subunit
LLVGNGVRSAGAADLVYSFHQKTNIPVLTTMNGVDLVQDDIHIGFIGTHGNRIANMMLNECDLLISVGARLGLRQVGRYKENFAPKAFLIRDDVDQYELSRDIKINEEKHDEDAKDFLMKLLAEPFSNYLHWMNQCEDAKKILDAYDKTAGNIAVEKISSFLIDNPVVAVDVGQNQCWSAQSLHLKGHYGRIFISGGYGTMGCGLPFAIGASISRKNGITYCITGDGGLQMNIQELQTVKREKLPIKILVLNNRVLGKISETQRKDLNNRFAETTKESGYTVPDFVNISQAYGIKAILIKNINDLDKYKSWFFDDEPCLINILLPEESYLEPKIQWTKCEIEPKLPTDIIEKVKNILRK